jgi:hypothetical protein
MVVKSRNMRWVGYVAQNEKMRNVKKLLARKHEEK